jgi:DNA processing protein
MAARETLEAKVWWARAGAREPLAAWHGAPAASRAAAWRIAAALTALGARALLASEEGYPAGLRELRRPPRVLFVLGALPEPRRAVAIVGSRAASPYGVACARRIARDLASLGYWIVSGLARGIDAAAHEGALEAGGASVAVLPGGLDAITPRHHRDLARTLCERGGLATEWPEGEPAGRAVFVERNRLIAGLAAATLVVEAAERSGALSTAAAARRLGRPLLAVPGDIDRPTARGAHALIRGGARLCESAGDVVRALGESWAGAPATSETAGSPGGAEARLLEALGGEARSTDALAAATGLGIDETLSALLRLEWAGAARALPGQRWARAVT